MMVCPDPLRGEIRRALPQLPRSFILVMGRLIPRAGGPRISIDHDDPADVDSMFGGGLTVPVEAEVEVDGGTYLVGWIQADGFPRLAGVVEAPPQRPAG